MPVLYDTAAPRSLLLVVYEPGAHITLQCNASCKEEEEKKKKHREREREKGKLPALVPKGWHSDPIGRNFGSRSKLPTPFFISLLPRPPPSCFLLVLFHCNILMMHSAHFAFPLHSSHSPGIRRRKSAPLLRVCSASGPTLALYKGETTILLKLRAK
jgi:hypothetical protein